MADERREQKMIREIICNALQEQVTFCQKVIKNEVNPDNKEYQGKIVDQALIQIKETLIEGIEKESKDIDQTCREFLPYSVADYIPELVKALKLQIQQIIKGMCK